MAKEVKEITIDELFAYCRQERIKGNGNKKILISSDDEGNEYHVLYYGFTPTKAEGEKLNFFEVAMTNYPMGVNEKNVEDYIILG
jgi:hypothetical protein